jgi:glycosyltransferase involved in cell wall biosynthesis
LKVGFIVANPLSNGLGYSLRPYMLIKYLSMHKDIEVHVFTPFDEIPIELKNVHFHKLKTTLSFIDTEQIVYRMLRSLIKKRILVKSFIYRSFVLNKLLQGFISALIKQLQRYHVDILQAEQDIPAAAAAFVGKILDIPTVADIFDMWAEEEALAGRIDQDDKVFKAIENISEKAILDSDVVLVGNEIVKKLIQSKWSLRSSKIIVSPNGGEIIYSNLQNLRKKRIVYAGNFEPYEYVDLFIEAIAFLLKEDDFVDISIFGKGPDEHRLRKLLKSYKLPNSIFKGYIPRSSLLSILAESFIGVVPTKKEYATPIKPFEYFSVGLPIVTIKGMWWSKVAEKYHAGITSNFDAKDFANAILKLLNTSNYKYYTEGAINAIKKEYNWYKITNDLVSVYKKLI